GGLHLLVALTRLSRSVAAQLLEKTAAPVASLRTTALGYLTGAIPRRRQFAVAATTPRAAVVTRAAPSAAPARVATLPPDPEPELRVMDEPAPRRALGAWDLDPREYPWLSTLARNLTALAAEGKL